MNIFLTGQEMVTFKKTSIPVYVVTLCSQNI
jgi:hypothetical protein